MYGCGAVREVVERSVIEPTRETFGPRFRQAEVASRTAEIVRRNPDLDIGLQLTSMLIGADAGLRIEEP